MAYSKDATTNYLFALRAELSAISFERDMIDRITNSFEEEKRSCVVRFFSNATIECCENVKMRLPQRRVWNAPAEEELVSAYIPYLTDSAQENDKEYFFRRKTPGAPRFTDANWPVKDERFFQVLPHHIARLVFGRCESISYSYLESLECQYAAQPDSADNWREKAFLRWFCSEECQTHYVTKYSELTNVIDAVYDQKRAIDKHSLRVRHRRAQRDFRELLLDNLVSARDALVRTWNEMNTLCFRESAVRDRAYAIRDDALTVYEALLVLNSEIMEEELWSKIDAMIYYVEAQRAGNLNDARIILANSKRMGMLAEDEENASAQICRKLTVGIRLLQSNLRPFYKRLQDMVGQVCDNDATELKTLIGTENLNNALYQKQFVSSNRLMEDLEYLKNFTY